MLRMERHSLVVRETEEFSQWLQGLRDSRAKAKILTRVDRLALGNPGDVAPVGGGVSEMRIDYGPGYRVYFAKQDNTVVLLLCGGNKATQEGDIKIAKALWGSLNEQTA